jgi:hypothetical protein
MENHKNVNKQHLTLLLAIRKPDIIVKFGFALHIPHSNNLLNFAMLNLDIKKPTQFFRQ